MTKFTSQATLIITLFICCFTVAAKAQLGYNFSQIDIGTAVGFNKVYGDAETQKTEQSVHFNFTYNQTPFTNFVLEVQLGKLRGGDSAATKSGRYFNNDFAAFVFRGQLQFGEFLNYSNSQFNNAFKNLYVSAGIGFVKNHITQVNRYSQKVPGYYTGGEDASTEPFIPLRLGYEFKLYNKYGIPGVKIDVGYGYNFVLGEGLDGFTAGKKNDQFDQYTIGVKFALGGPITSYRKQITY